ncbi:MAG: T9SS type A sorting domain-containing protein [Bacteroidota bacterium]
MKKRLLFIFAGMLSLLVAKAQCNANFTYSISANTISVTAATTATGTAFYAWQWGDAFSVPGSGQSASYTYSTSGTYSLCLTYIEFGFPPCSTQVCQNVVIGSVGIKEYTNADNRFNISPNPAGSFINVDYSLTRSARLSISLMDVTGKLVDHIEAEKDIQIGNYSKRYSLEHLSSGIYFIRFKTENGTETKKLIVD